MGKRFCKWGAVLLIVVLALFFGCQSTPGSGGSGNFQYGKLQVKAGQLCGEDGNPVQLKGMSSFGLQWADGSWVLTDKAFDVLKKDWKCEVIRLAMYVSEGGYASNPSLILERMEKGITLATKRGMYVLVDWHMLSPGDPTSPVYLTAGLNDDKMPDAFKAIAAENPRWTGPQVFFAYIAQKYGAQGNILYEPANEPNGLGTEAGRFTTWRNKLKPYFESVIESIRKYDKDGIVICGTDNWSQFVDAPLQARLTDPNVMYAMHFYAGTHDAGYGPGKKDRDPRYEGEYWLRKMVDSALAGGLAVFCTEWGSSEATGDGGPYIDFAVRWMKYLEDKRISWCAWSMAQKNEISAAFNSTTSPNPGSKWPDSQVSVAGRFYRAMIRGDAVPMYHASESVTNFSSGQPFPVLNGDSPNKLVIEQGKIGKDSVARLKGVSTGGIWDNRIQFSDLGVTYGIYLELTFDVYLQAAKVDTKSDTDAFIVKPIFQYPPSWWDDRMPEVQIPQNAFTSAGSGWVKATVTMPLAPLVPSAKDAVTHLIFLVSLTADTEGSDVCIGRVELASNYNGDVRYVPEIPDEPGEFVRLPFTFESGTREGWKKDGDSKILSKLLSVAKLETQALKFPLTFEPGKNEWEDGARLTSPFWPETALNLAACRNIAGIGMDIYLESGQATKGGLEIAFIPVPDGAGYWHEAGRVKFNPVSGGSVITANGKSFRKYRIVVPFKIADYSEAVRVRNLVLALYNDNSDYSGDIYYDNIGFLTQQQLNAER